MSSIILNGDTSGSITVSAPSVAGTNTVTLPQASGQLMVSGNMPAFSAYAGSSTTITNNSNTKVLFNTVSFDTNSNYSTANSRFQPTVAGYYYITAQANLSITGNANPYLYKNGSAYIYGPVCVGWSGISATTANITAFLYLNGSTDYVEFYVYQASGGSITTTTGANYTYFAGSMVRAA